MIYQIKNEFGSGYDYIESDNDDLANEKLNANKVLFFQQHEYLFSVAKLTIIDNDTTWINADLDKDMEDFIYQVFNPYTGLHEEVNSLTLAKSKRQEHIDSYINNAGFSTWEIVDAMPPAPNNKQPITTIAEF